MALQNTDNFLVSRTGTSHKLSWADLQTDIGGSLTINDAFTTTGDPVTAVESVVPYSAAYGIQLPVSGINDYEIAGSLRYNTVAEKVELYDGSAWVIASGTTSFTAAPPTPASIGDIWYDIDDGRAYVYYNDGDSSQWVELNPSWNGGIPPEAITPEKMSAGGIQWSTQGYHAINRETPIAIWLDVNTADSNLTGIRVTADSGHTARIRINEETTTQVLELGQTATQNYITSGAAIPLNIETTTTSDINLRTNSVDRLTVDGFGRVGIGTTTPVQPFEVFSAVSRFDGTGFDGRGVSVRTDDATFETFIVASRDLDTDGTQNVTGITFKYADVTTVADVPTEIHHKVNGTTQLKTDSTGVSVTGDVKPSNGVVLQAPDGGLWRVTVANDGSLTTTSV